MDRTLVLEFEEYPDDEIRVRLGPVPLSEYERIVAAYSAALDILPEPIVALVEAWAPFLESWTFPEPATAEGMKARDPNLILAIVGNWIRGVRQAPLPLRRTSSAGEPSVEQPA